MCFQRNMPINRSKKSLKQLNELIAQNPDDYRYRLDRALFYAFDDKHENMALAKEDVKKAADTCKYYWLFIIIAKYYLAIGDPQSALTCLKKARRMNRKHGWPLAMVGLCYLRLGNYNEAMVNLNQSIDWSEQGKYLEQIKYLAECYGALGEYEKEMELIFKIISETKQLSLSLVIPQLHLDICLQQNPTDHIYHFLKGYSLQDEPSQAIECYSKAIESNPNFAVSYAFRAKTYADLGGLDNALFDILRALELEPGSHRFCLWRAQILEKRGEFGSKTRIFDNPDAPYDPDYCFEVAKLSMNLACRSEGKERKKNFRIAEWALRAGIRSLRPSRQCWYQLGVLFELKMEPSKARYYYRKAENIDLLKSTKLPFTLTSTL